LHSRWSRQVRVPSVLVPSFPRSLIHPKPATRLIAYVQFTSANPDILVLWTLIATLSDNLSRCNLFSRNILQPSRCDPPWSMLWIRLDEGLKKSSRSFDVPARQRESVEQKMRRGRERQRRTQFRMKS